MHNMQTKTGRAFMAARSEERIERLASDLRSHPAAVIGKHDLDLVIP